MEKVDKSKKFNWRLVGKIAVLVLWVGVACIAVQYIVGYPLLWILGKETFTTPLWTTIYSALTYIVTALVVIFIPKKIKKNWGTTRIELGLSNLPTFVDIGLGLLGFIATILISAFVTNIMSGFDWFDANQAQNIGYNVLNTGFDRIVAFLALVVFAPIAEEIIFRGWLYGKLRKTIAAPAAIILVSFLFGFLHGQLNVGITVGIMSIAMRVEREMTGTIYASILTHMIKNGIAFWIIYVLT